MHVSLSAQNIVKHYGAVVALSDGNLEIESGQVVALLGANGSGKSTLSKVITGVVVPNGGQLLLDNQVVNFPSPQAAKKAGISAVYQELSLIPDMTVAENIWLTHEPLWFNFISKRGESRARTRDLIALFDGTVSASLEPDTPVNALPPDERQIVEILKALSMKPRLMILDEATASLDSQQVTRLFDLVADWKAQHMAVVFVSHRMNEIFRVADRATVLRNGMSVGEVAISETNETELVSMMTGEAAHAREIGVIEAKDLSQQPIRLRVTDLNSDILKDMNFELRDGELLGIGGLQGQGQSRLLLTLFGAMPYTGAITLSGEVVKFKHPKDAMRKDVAFVPGDRGSEGLLSIRSIMENLHLPSWAKFGFPLNMERARQEADKVSNDLRIVMASLNAPVSSLSGGNAQKIVIGKWLLRKPNLLLLNDPTKGVDVSAKEELYTLLAELRAQGTAILFYSSDDEELLNLCDRVLVLHDGRIQAELAGDTLNRAELVAASMGTTRESAE